MARFIPVYRKSFESPGSSKIVMTKMSRRVNVELISVVDELAIVGLPEDQVLWYCEAHYQDASRDGEFTYDYVRYSDVFSDNPPEMLT